MTRHWKLGFRRQVDWECTIRGIACGTPRGSDEAALASSEPPRRHPFVSNRVEAVPPEIKRWERSTRAAASAWSQVVAFTDYRRQEFSDHSGIREIGLHPLNKIPCLPPAAARRLTASGSVANRTRGQAGGLIFRSTPSVPTTNSQEHKNRHNETGRNMPVRPPAKATTAR
jgi:hypothetical protein